MGKPPSQKRQYDDTSPFPHAAHAIETTSWNHREYTTQGSPWHILLLTGLEATHAVGLAIEVSRAVGYAVFLRR